MIRFEVLFRRRLYLAFFLALGGFITFFISVNIYIAVLMATGINRGHIEDLIANAEQECRNYPNADRTFVRHIHQIWNTPDVPPQFKDAVASCKRLNPHYNYTLWLPHQRRSFIRNTYPWFLPTYDGYSQEIMRIDAVRYFILHHYGGIYLDIDMECKTPFDVIQRNTTATTGVLLGATVPSGCGNSWVIGKKNHPFLNFVNHRLVTEDRWYVLPYMSVLLSTGPIFLWRAYLNFPCKEQVYIVDPSTHNNIYYNHLHHSSWHSWDGPLFLFLDVFYKRILVHLLEHPVWTVGAVVMLIALHLVLRRTRCYVRAYAAVLRLIIPRIGFIKKSRENGSSGLLKIL